MYLCENAQRLVRSVRLIIIEFNYSLGSKHVTRNQKGRQMLNIINQNQTFITLLPFKTIVIVAS
jgi:hypothetical protein